MVLATEEDVLKDIITNHGLNGVLPALQLETVFNVSLPTLSLHPTGLLLTHTLVVLLLPLRIPLIQFGIQLPTLGMAL